MNDETRALGPLKFLAGVWEGSKGNDRAPADDPAQMAVSEFRERITFQPIGEVANHAQKLYGLRYATVACRLGDEDPFHEEVGYWLWDPEDKQVLRCFIVPRGVSVIAGGTAAEDATSFDLEANLGSETYGICSNRFLDQEFKTIRYELKVTIHDADSFSYEEDTQLEIKGQPEIFHHRDRNTLQRVS